MQKIKFDFEATKQIIDVAPDASVRIGAPVNANGVLANDGTAIGVVLDAQGVGVHRQLVVMVAGYCDIIDAQAIWGDEYSAEAIAAMSDITFCDNHQLPTGGGGGAMVVNLETSIGQDGITITADKSFAEISANAPNVLCKSSDPSNPSMGYIYSRLVSAGDEAIVFSVVLLGVEKFILYTYKCNNDDTWEIHFGFLDYVV